MINVAYEPNLQLLDKVVDFADSCHGDQVRKYSGERYIVHPLRVMHTCKEYTDNLAVLWAALLHDVLEDTPVTQDQILTFLKSIGSDDMAVSAIRIVVELTDVYTKDNYPSFNRRKRKNLEVSRLSNVSAEAQTIKYADIIDNSVNIAENDPDFAVVYLLEGKHLLREMKKGNAVLHRIAERTIDACLKQLEQNYLGEG